MEELFDPYELRQALMDLARDIRDAYVENLTQSKHYTTEYALIDSVRTDVVVDGREFSVVMTLNDYWKYLEEDTKPHFPPPDKLLQWIEIKPISIPKNYAKIPTPAKLERYKRSLAYLIGRKIAREGTKGTHDLQRAKDALIPYYEQRLQEALGRDVERYIRKVMY